MTYDEKQSESWKTRYWLNSPSSFREKEYYVVELPGGGRIREYLGEVNLRADGKWDWFSKKSNWYDEFWTGPDQGVAETKEDAIKKVENHVKSM